MLTQIDEITGRILAAGLAVKGEIVFCHNKNEIYGEHKRYNEDMLISLSRNLNRDVLLVCTPSEPYRSVINYLAESGADVIYPRDYETRVLLSDLPVIKNTGEQAFTDALCKRRGALIRGGDIIVASKDLRMAYITFSSVCFACFVKFFSDYLCCFREGTADERFKSSFRASCDSLHALPDFNNSLMKGRFIPEDDVMAAIEEAGKLTVASRLVDSSFGNISYLKGRTLYISRTGTYLNDLRGRIDAVDLDSPEKVPATVSSEFPVHREIVRTTGMRAVIHGHPKFAVIMSMACDKRDCLYRDSCQTMCPSERYAAGIPVVPGESGTGQYGLYRKLPAAMKISNSVIVYGHGVFSAGAEDFNEAFSGLLNAERKCRAEYFNYLHK